MKHYTDAELEGIRQESLSSDLSHPRARAVGYDASIDAVTLLLTSGIRLEIPARLIEGLQDATQRQLSAVEVSGQGYAIGWEALDVHMSVEGLITGILGTQRWMNHLATELARRGGRSKTPAKRAAARSNGKLGGRPRKQKELA